MRPWQLQRGVISADSGCHSVLVPAAAELGISLGVTGREPLNNQPYFRMTRLGDNQPVHAGGPLPNSGIQPSLRERQLCESGLQAQESRY